MSPNVPIGRPATQQHHGSHAIHRDQARDLRFPALRAGSGAAARLSAADVPHAGHGSLSQFHDSLVRQAMLFLDSEVL
jgi:hypothetical protein